MKTIEEIMDSGRPNNEIIQDLQQKCIAVPSWEELNKEYDPNKHPVKSDSSYMDIVNKNGGITKVTRITLGLQKLAVKRMSELAFGIPVKRVYNAETDEQQKAARVLESIMIKNRIDSVNLDRAKKLYASCEVCTIWYAQEAQTIYAGEKSAYKLRCKTYSPMDGDTIYPLFDDFDDMIALSVKYSRTINNNTVNYFETYTATEHMRWKQDGSVWVEDMEREKIQIDKIAGVYAYRKEAIWEDESTNVYEAEWALSRNGNYIRKNAKPNWVVCADKEEMVKFKHATDNDNTSRNILFYPKDAKVGYETWSQSIEALKFHIEQIKSNFFTQLQLPDMSFEQMKTMAVSGEARKMVFIDAQLKVLDETGVWIEFFSREMSVVKAFAKQLFPKLAKSIDELEIEFIITPYQINDDETRIKNLSTACGSKAIMSQRTAIELLAEVDDPDAELQQIQREDAMAMEEVVM